jgi:cell division protein FtsI/penicillin-binding protein 2
VYKGVGKVANVTFSGSAKDTTTSAALTSAAVTITVTKPDGTTDIISTTTDSNGNYSATKTYTAVGNYNAVANVTATGYNPGSASKPFTIAAVLQNMTVTLNVVSA